MKSLGAFLLRILEAWRSGHGGDRAPTANIGCPFQFPGKKFLHVGCGPARKPNVPPGLLHADWQEIRLDIDSSVAPDIVSSILDMSIVPTESVDAVYSSHNIEHLYPHEVPVALSEFWRVLQPDGVLILTCPDLQSIAPLIADDRLDEPAYVSAVGPIAPLDMLYGHRPQLARGNLFMAHRTGFTQRTLINSVRAVGFPSVAARRREDAFDLWIVASKAVCTEQEMQQLADTHLP